MIDFSQELKNIDGSSLPEALTLGAVVQNSLLFPFADEKDLSGEEKAKRAGLALRIHAGEGNLTAEDIALCKRLVGKAYAPLVVYRAWQALDPASLK